MSLLRPYAGPQAPVRSRTAIAADGFVMVLVAILFWLIIDLSHGFARPFNKEHTSAGVSTNLANLPYYAGASLLRMFIALALSVIFTFVYATAAARSRRAEKVLIPILDILQSVPVLTFLSVTVTMWLALFPHSTMGIQCASIFAVFTSQAWNMTFAFYQSLVTQPRDLDEAARLMRLTKWQRFWQLDVPSAMIPLVWNGMMSFGGGWFFLTASEMISVGNSQYAVPGIGSFVGSAIAQKDMGKVLIAIGAMIVMIIAVNFFFWRPLTAWAERFRMGDSDSSEKQKSMVLSVLRRSRVPYFTGLLLRPLGRGLDRLTRHFGLAEHPLRVSGSRRRAGDIVFGVIVVAVAAWGLYKMLTYVAENCGLGQFPHALVLGFITFVRVMVLVAASSVIWVPVGVWIGMNPRINRYAQPVVQVLASFPANFLFPFFTILMIDTGISLNYGGIVLMALGAQWYILFNVIAGASAIPTDLREAVTNLRLSRVQKWKSMILPAIFSAWVTGGITAAGGAWNASIVAEIVTYGHTTLTATGLGAYIAQAAALTSSDAFSKALVGATVMSIFVVGVNRLFWRRLYALVESRYSLT